LCFTQREVGYGRGDRRNQPVRRGLKLGIVGIGVGASEILPQMEGMPGIQLVAAADINGRVLDTFQHRYGSKTYDSFARVPNTQVTRLANLTYIF
jgi:predicted homoserine dehydrogenase-like protein